MPSVIQPPMLNATSPIVIDTTGDNYTSVFNVEHLQEKTILVATTQQPMPGDVLFAQVEISFQTWGPLAVITNWAPVGTPSNLVAINVGASSECFAISWTLHSAFCRVRLWIPTNLAVNQWTIAVYLMGKGW